MDDVDFGKTTAPARVGEVLQAAREAHGLTLADVGARTRIPTRHLAAIESGDYAGLPSTTYAMGFAKAYARAVGADEVKVAADVRVDVARMGRRQPEYTPYEIVDQTRVPSRGIVIVAAGLALAVLILVGLFYGTDMLRSGGGSTPVAQMAAPRAPAPLAVRPVQPAGGQVTLAATDEVWLRVYDADGKTLRQGTMKPGERYDVPGDAKDPQINVGRPDKLAVTLNGSAIPPLGDGSRAIKDVRVSAAAIAARLANASTPPAG